MQSILFICHGNICRSPMAEFVMKDILRRHLPEEKYCVESAATSREEIGNPIYPPVRRVLKDMGVAFDSKKTARQVTASDYDRFDLLVCMDKQNIRNLERIIPNDPFGKICRLMDFTEHPRDVADPWYTGDFMQTEHDVTEGCRALFETFFK